MSKLPTHQHFIRGQIEHFDFITGLKSALSEGAVPPKVRLDVVLGCTKVVLGNGWGEVWGRVFQCTQMMEYFYGHIGGTHHYDYDKASFVPSKPQCNGLYVPEGFEQPTHFTFETWRRLDERGREWQQESQTGVFGVKVLAGKHTSDGGTRCCAAQIDFTYDTTETNPMSSEVVDIGERKSWVELMRVLTKGVQ